VSLELLRYRISRIVCTLLFVSSTIVDRIWISSVGPLHSYVDSATLERAQRRFLSQAGGYVLSIPHPSHDYSPVLRELWLLSTIANRRVDNNIKFLLNLVDDSADAPSLLFLPYQLQSPSTFDPLYLLSLSVPVYH